MSVPRLKVICSEQAVFDERGSYGNRHNVQCLSTLSKKLVTMAFIYAAKFESFLIQVNHFAKLYQETIRYNE